MERIQDKALDQLFKDRFNGAEMQPSAAVWDAIGKELKPKRKHKPAMYWMVAATVAIALSVVLLLTRTDEGTRLREKEGRIADQHPAGSTGSLPMKQEELSPSVSVPGGSKLAVDQRFKAFKVHPSSANKGERTLVRLKSDRIRTESRGDQPRRLILESPVNTAAPITLRADEHQGPALALDPAHNGDLALISGTPAAIPLHAGLMPRDADRPSAEANGLQEDLGAHREEGRARIRNAGDLVNFVVDKLDKREQKLVEFNTDDDDNSSLVAINIGPFRFNSKKNK